METNNTEKGKLIAIEGIDGSGKGTQVKLLVNYLRNELKMAVQVIEFPQYGEKSAQLVESYLNGDFGKNPNAYGAKVPSMMFALDRAIAAPQIREWLENGNIVIANRYTTSNMGHQAGKIQDSKKRDEFLNRLENLEHNDCNIPRPDAVIYIDMPPEIAQKNVDKKSAEQRQYVGGKKRDIHEADLNHLKNSAEAYRYVADKYGWLKLNPAPDGVLRSIEENQKELINLLKENGII